MGLATLLTLFVDASHCPHTLAGGWGAWAKREGWAAGRTKAGRVNTAKHASEAELKGIANALSAYEADGSLEGLTAVMIKSDSFTAMRLIVSQLGARQSAKELEFNDGPVFKVKPGYKDALERIKDIRDRNKLELICRHVKAHVSNGNTSNNVNNICDELARTQMQAMRNEAPTGVRQGMALAMEIQTGQKTATSPIPEKPSRKARWRRRKRQQKREGQSA